MSLLCPAVSTADVKQHAIVATLSNAEVNAHIQRVLPEPVALEVDTNLIEAGLDSLHLMRLVDTWRRAGARVTFAQLIEKPTFGHWLHLLNATTTDAVDVDDFATIQARTYCDQHYRSVPFDLTDVQYAYWIGRQDDRELGGVGCHAYLEIDGQGVEPARLQTAWARLIQQHPMLRAHFTDAGQQYIADAPTVTPLLTHDFSLLSADEAQQQVMAIRARLSHRKLNIELGQVMGLELSLLPEGKTRIHFDLDLLVADVQSLHILLRDLAAAYASDAPLAADKDWRFAHYLAIEAERNQTLHADAHDYWQQRLADLPSGPQLPLALDPKQLHKTEFSRRTYMLQTPQWDALRQIAAQYQVTPAVVLASAYAEVLARWSAEPRFLLNIPLFDRQTDHPQIEDAVADFTNLLLLECDYRVPLPFIERVKQVQQQLYRDVAHASYSGVRIQRDLVKQGLTDGVSAPVVFACNLGTPLLTPECKTTLGDLHYMISQTPQVWLDHQLYEMDEGLLLAWDAVDALFPDNVIDDMFTAYTQLLEWLAADAQHWQQETLELMPAYQQTQRQAVNATEAARIEHVLHHGLFEIAAQQPERIALIDNEGSLTYGQLAEQALRIANWLTHHGVEVGEPIAVTLPRGMQQIIAVIGVLAAGGCYVPVGVHQPAARQAKIHTTAGIRWVLTDAEHLEAETINGVVRLNITDAEQAAALSAPIEVSPAQSAYIIFTSGSTGEPKGVEMAHHATANTIDHLNQRYGVHADSRVLAVSALDFDLSVYDIFGLLSIGGALVVLDETQRRDANIWLDKIFEHQVTLWNSVPVLLDMLLVVAENDPRQLPFEQVMLSGDWIGLDIPPRLFAKTSDAVHLIAMGGATEAAIWSNAFDVQSTLPAHWTSIPYGKPLENQQYRVVNAQGRDCPDWVSGELWIGGVGVAEGYRGDSKLTAERFVHVNGQRWYRTGDRGRYWADGNLEFMGRLDHQVKVRGHRIELGEIETALVNLPWVSRAVVVTVGQPLTLAAGIVLKNLCDTVDIEEIRAALYAVLPDYMVPSMLSLLAKIPLSANGKVDRKKITAQLSALVGDNSTAVLTAPQTKTESAVANLWRQLLGIEQIGRESSFFALGGDSLLATQVITQLRLQGLSAAQPLRLLFAKPTLMDFAAGLHATEVVQQLSVVADAENRYQPFPLTEVQRAYWMGQSPGLPLNCGTHYLVELDGAEVDLPRMEQAWNRLVQRHDMMRAVVDNEGQQRVLATVPHVTIAVSHIRDHGKDDNAAAAQQYLHDCWHQQSRQHREQLVNQDTTELPWPPYRLHAVHYGDNRCRVGIVFDYLTLDGFSIKLLLEELADLYRDPSHTFPELGLSFRDYVNQVCYTPEQVQQAETFWRNKLNSLPLAPELPLAMDPAALIDVAFQRREARLSTEQWQSLRDKARQHQITPSVLLLVAYSHIIRRWSGGSDHTLNLTLFDRQAVHDDINKVLGDFTSLAPVAFLQQNGDNLLAQAQATQQEIAEALEHRAISSIWIQRERSHHMSLTAAALPVVFTSTLGLGGGLFENPPPGFPDLVAGGLSETPQVWLDHQVYEYKGELALSWDAAEALFPAGLLDAMFSAYVYLLEDLISQDWAAPLQVALPNRQAVLRGAMNATAAPRTEHVLHQGMFDTAASTPERVALIADDETWLYGQLADRALRIAQLLVQQGLAVGEPVAVTLPRGIGQISAVFGVLAAGGCYVPVGTHQPAARQAKIHSTAGIRWVLTDAKHLDAETIDGVTRLDIATAVDLTPLLAPIAVSPEQAAYIIFTSGSTGEPKGVEMAHHATANTIDDINKRYGVHADSRTLAVSALDFDLSVYDLFGLLSVGGAVVVLDEAQRRDANVWLDKVFQHNVTLWNSVPVLLDMLLIVAENDPRQLPFEQVMLSGDWIGLDIPPRLFANTTDKVQLVAMGGATEAAIWSNAYDIKGELPADWTSIPYGKPLANQQYRVVDVQGHDCPEWVPGELWIGGVGVAEGYRGDPKLTAERFVRFNGKRWYRTGDRGRYWPDGNLEFMGRLDFQVKVRGHRIELGEIETALLNLPQVNRAVVVTVGKPLSLAAGIVPEDSSVELDSEAIRAALHDALPDYMVPSTLSVLDSVPLSANGKVDRKQVTAKLEGLVSDGEDSLTPPETEIEQAVAALWQDLLNVEQIGRESSFFLLGGDSLLATQVIAQLRQQGLSAEQPLRTLFAKPMLKDFAAVLTQSEAALQPSITAQPEQRHEPFPLTEVQRAYWMGQAPGLPLNCGTHYMVELDGVNVNIARIEQAWNQLLLRHDMLRAVLDDQGQQRVLPQVEPCRFSISDRVFSNLTAAQAELQHWWQHYSQQERATLFAAKAVYYGEQRCRLALLFNYLTLDGFSIKLLLNELATLYDNPEAALPPLTLSFRDYVTQVTPEPAALARAETYWRDRLDSLPNVAALPLVRDPMTLSHVTFTRREAKLDREAWAKLRQSAREYGITPSVLILVAYGDVLSQWSGGNAHTLNLTLFDRQNVHPEINHIVGDFTSLAPVPYYPDPNKSLLELAQEIQNNIAEALEHREISSIWVQRERAHHSSLTAAALPIVFTSTLGMADSLFDTPPVEGFPDLAGGGLSETPQVWLDHQMYEHRGELLMSWDSVDALFPEGLLDTVFAHFVELLHRLADGWTQPLPYHLPAAQVEVRQAVNATAAAREERVLHQGMFDIAARTPERIALIADDVEVTYAQLATQALRIAQLLRQHGMQTGEPVAVTLPRGIAQISAVFGVLAAGGCYMPVGVHQPATRQAKIHRTADIRWVLTDTAHLEADSIEGVTRLDIAQASAVKPLNAPIAVSPEQTAYIIFTSGSTGEPKGVEMAHHATANTIDHLNQRYGVHADSRVLAVSALDFDLSVYDLFGLLNVGGAVVVLQEEQRRDASVWLEKVFQHQITLWNSVPVLFDMLLVVAENDARTLPFEQVMLSGDWIGLDIPARLFAQTHAKVQLIAMGGATEAAIWSNAFDVKGALPPHWTSIPYGTPLANQQYRVVDAFRRDCPDWVAGELWIGGVGVAEGYCGDPQLTSERFVRAQGNRWYRTGDRGRYWPDGNLEFMGRLDHQVKVRGHRIELGEIETALLSLPQIGRAIVVTVGQPLSLAAGIVPEDPTTPLDIDAIRAALHDLLPDYMVPTTLVTVEHVPLSANGKVDRQQMSQQLAALSHAQDHYQAPVGDLEQQVAEVWCEVLACERISRHDEFFLIGGDSLTATQIVQLLHQRRVSPEAVSLFTLFSSPTIAGLSDHIRAQWQALGSTDTDTDTVFEEGLL